MPEWRKHFEWIPGVRKDSQGLEQKGENSPKLLEVIRLHEKGLQLFRAAVPELHSDPGVPDFFSSVFRVHQLSPGTCLERAEWYALLHEEGKAKDVVREGIYEKYQDEEVLAGQWAAVRLRKIHAYLELVDPTQSEDELMHIKLTELRKNHLPLLNHLLIRFLLARKTAHQGTGQVVRHFSEQRLERFSPRVKAIFAWTLGQAGIEEVLTYIKQERMPGSDWDLSAQLEHETALVHLSMQEDEAAFHLAQEAFAGRPVRAWPFEVATALYNRHLPQPSDVPVYRQPANQRNKGLELLAGVKNQMIGEGPLPWFLQDLGRAYAKIGERKLFQEVVELMGENDVDLARMYMGMAVDVAASGQDPTESLVQAQDALERRRVCDGSPHISWIWRRELMESQGRAGVYLAVNMRNRLRTDFSLAEMKTYVASSLEDTAVRSPLKGVWNALQEETRQRVVQGLSKKQLLQLKRMIVEEEPSK